MFVFLLKSEGEKGFFTYLEFVYGPVNLAIMSIMPDFPLTYVEEIVDPIMLGLVLLAGSYLAPRVALSLNLFCLVFSLIGSSGRVLSVLQDPSTFEFRILVVPILFVLLVLLSYRAIRNCPEFIPEWRTCNPEPWDIRQMIDPLNIRRHAAPWQLIRLGGVEREPKI